MTRLWGRAAVLFAADPRAFLGARQACVSNARHPEARRAWWP